jgi:DNA (cytosine-5)-methyltransferase 1
LADKLKPKWIIWENVPGVLSSNGGRDFGSFLGALVELGYGFAYRILDAQYVGGSGAVPQRRRRVFVVASLGDWRGPSEVLSLRESLRWNLEASKKKRDVVAADAGAVPDSSMPVVIDRAAFNQGENAKFDPHIAQSEVMDSLVARGPHAVGVPNCKISGTIRANPGSGWRSNGTPVEPVVITSMSIRRLTCVETERLQGFPDNWSRISWKGKPAEECPDGPRYKACGNSMAVPVMRFIGENIHNLT